MSGTLNVFLIYTKQDSGTLLQLLRHLDPIKNDLKVHFWYDDPVFPDKEWYPQIVSRFEEADVYLLLVSNALMYSKFMEQVEFKMIIDRYKIAKSKVIPLLLENCPWDVDFNADQYTFSFKELDVLPEKSKPLIEWESPNDELQRSADTIKKALLSFKDGDAQKPLKKKWGEIAVSDEKAMEKRAADEKKQREEAKAKQKAAEEQRLKEAVIAEKKWEEEEVRLRAEAEAKRKAKQEAWLQEKAEEKSRTQTKEKTSVLLEPSEKNQGTNTRKKVLLGFSAAALVAVLIALFSGNSFGNSKEVPVQSQKETGVVKNSDEANEQALQEKPKTTTLGAGASISKLAIGSRYENGLIFEFGEDGKLGKVVHTKDLGPMIWNDAMKIDEELGEGWRLPTLDELKTIHKILGQGADNQGEFTDGLYWSATPYDANQARLIRFSDGNTSFHYNSIGEFRKFPVRAVRDVDLK